MTKTFMCKAILNKEAASTLGMDWALSKRCLLKFSSDYLEADELRIPFAEIKSATLQVVPSAFFLPGCILTIVTLEGVTNHFGLRYSAFWKRDFPFPLVRSRASAPSLWLRRAIILSILFFILLKVFGKYLF